MQTINGTQVDYKEKNWNEIGGKTKELIQQMFKNHKKHLETTIKAGTGKISIRLVENPRENIPFYIVNVEKEVPGIYKNYNVKVPPTIAHAHY